MPSIQLWEDTAALQLLRAPGGPPSIVQPEAAVAGCPVGEGAVMLQRGADERGGGGGRGSASASARGSGKTRRKLARTAGKSGKICEKTGTPEKATRRESPSK